MALTQYQPRRRFLEPVLELPPTNPNKTLGSYTSEANFDSNMVIVLAALLCALICALGLNSIVRCAIRCSYRFAFETPEQATPHLATTTGLKKSALNHIPVLVYGLAGLNLPVTDCPICLGEFTEGEKLRILPKCNHGFHVKCIDKWLVSQSSCPLCRQALLDHPTNYKAEEANVRVQLMETGQYSPVMR